MFSARPVASLPFPLLMVTLAPLWGCSAAPKATGAAAPPAQAVVEDDQATLPTLAAELSAGDSRKVQDLSLTLNVMLEELTKATAPAWYAQAATASGRAAGTATAATLSEAFDSAITIAGATIEARGMNPTSLVVEQAAWQRLSTGQFVAWAGMGDGSRRVAPPLPRVANISSPANVIQPALVAAGGPALPTLQNPKGGSTLPGNEGLPPLASPLSPRNDGLPPVESLPTLAQPRTLPAGDPPVAPVRIADSGVPAWWSDKPSIRAGRLSLGIITEGQTGREAARASLRGAREQLKLVVNEEPREVITDRSLMVTLPDGRTRLYAMTSCLLPSAEQPK